ncbi:MAG: hypothetical protein GY874_00640 [Desulfobacteraceae bacterium]|nr:hypothetical protein [Desulfobacteraceae bacterium]
MNLNEHAIESRSNCDLCDQTRNQVSNKYNGNCFCPNCSNCMEDVPNNLAKSVERFLIGNVV